MCTGLSHPRTAPITGVRRFIIDATAMFVYLWIVYVWSLTLYPLGRDYACMADPAARMPFLARGLLGWEVHTFGAHAVPYHLVNLALLYACMLLLYRFVRLAVRGPVWLGTLAATLFMANPVHSEAVLNLCGAADLLPCLFALLALTLYAEHAAAPRFWKLASSVGVFAVAALPYDGNAFLLLVVVLFEALVVEKEKRRPGRLVPFLVVSLACWIFNRSLFAADNFDLTAMFVPLYFVFYPIGFLPETARSFQEAPWLLWVAAAFVAFVAALICRKAKRPAIVFGLLSMLALRLGAGGRVVDPVHLVGGGRLLLANALFNVALAALFYRMMDHRKWQKPVVMLTTFLALVLFGLQIRAVVAWQHAGRIVRQFQADAVSAEGPVGVLPDYQYYVGAPIRLAEAVAHDTPFSQAVPAVPLFPLNYAPSERVAVTVPEWTAESGTVVVRGREPLDLIIYPYALAHPGASVRTQHATVELVTVEPSHLVFRVTPHTPPLPRTLLPVQRLTPDS